MMSSTDNDNNINQSFVAPDPAPDHANIMHDQLDILIVSNELVATNNGIDIDPN
jgi:hypothetical protein